MKQPTDGSNFYFEIQKLETLTKQVEFLNSNNVIMDMDRNAQFNQVIRRLENAVNAMAIRGKKVQS